MQFFQSQEERYPQKGYAITRPGTITINLKNVGIVVVCLLLSNFITLRYSNSSIIGQKKAENQMYLLDKASIFVHDVQGFEQKVRSVGKQLRVPPEWLMAIMYSESKFDASVANHKGSGAVGLIQWMPATAKDMQTTVAELRNMNHIQQMDYVFRYLQRVRTKYGDFNSLTDLYLAVLYPRSLDNDYCYTLYAKPSVAYVKNSGLDEDKDGRVTVSDIDRRMKRIYPTAYMKSAPNSNIFTGI